MALTITEMRDQAAARQARCLTIKRMIVERLDLPIDPEWITDDQPIIGRGLELDSVDTLELMVGIEAEFDVSITDDEMHVFGSISRLLDRIDAGTPEAFTALYGV
jgi:acyl carrier protein